MAMRQRIRDGLALSHERLDARMTALCLSPSTDVRRLLLVHGRALPPVVAGLRSMGGECLWPEWDGPARVSALLQALGPDATAVDSLQPEKFDNDAMVWGGLYALLGSRLGNRVIVRNLAAAGQPTDIAFLQPGPDDALEWRRFLARMEAALGPTGAAISFEDAIEGALRVMGRYLEAVGHVGRVELSGAPRD